MTKGTSQPERRIVGSDRDTDNPPNETNISIKTFSISIMISFKRFFVGIRLLLSEHEKVK